MKTLFYISRMVFVAVVVVLLSSNLAAQKVYRGISLENGIVELNNLVNSLIEKGKIKYNLINTFSVSEMNASDECMSENELNELIANMGDVVKFDSGNTLLVISENEENSELNQLTNNLMESIRFDVHQTFSVASEADDDIELNQLTGEMMEKIKFDISKTISVQEGLVVVAF